MDDDIYGIAYGRAESDVATVRVDFASGVHHVKNDSGTWVAVAPVSEEDLSAVVSRIVAFDVTGSVVGEVVVPTLEDD